MNEQATQAFLATGDAFKQMMTLSTGVLTLELTLLKDVIKDLPGIAGVVLGISWVSFLFALIFGIAGMLAITGTLSKTLDPSPSSIYEKNIRIPAFGQVVFFGLGMLLTVIFGIIFLWVSTHT